MEIRENKSYVNDEKTENKTKRKQPNNLVVDFLMVINLNC